MVMADLRNQGVAFEANKHLPESQRLSELDISKLVTCRKTATPKQAEAIAKVVGVSSKQLFDQEAMNVGQGN